MIHYIYKTINNINNKYYLGKHSTENLDDTYLGSGKLLKLAIMKYGKENFTRLILAYADTEKQAYEFEERLIKISDITNSNCYNIVSGGHGFNSDETNPMYGTAGELNIHYGKSNPFYNKHHTKESKAKISKAISGKNNPMYGKCGAMNDKHHTDETKLKISNANKGSKHGRSRKVAQLDKETLEIIKIYDYIKLTELDNFNPCCVSACCNKIQYIHKVFKWKHI